MAFYLVTGGSGFVGTLLVSRLLDEGHDVASIDLLPTSLSHPRLRATIGDIRDRATLDAIYATGTPDAVFHCAALLAHGSISTSDMMSHNVEGTRVLAQASAAAHVRKIVYLSSNCLWGRGFDRPVDLEQPEPCEAYGVSKLEGERVLAALGDRIETVAIRCPTIIDEGRLGLLAILFEFIADGNRVWLVGKGDNRYQFIYAADLLNAMIRAAHVPGSHVFGIGSDNVPTMAETFQHVIDGTGSRSRLAAVPKAPMIAAMKIAHHLRISPLGPYHYRMIASSFVFDTSRIKQVLGWQPTLTNGEMLLKAYRYYDSNRAEIAARADVSAHRQATKMGVIRVLKYIS
ncbi:NAD-dependent epimerase/dehydratase family protein [Altererythrobacter xixiisoli]|uniref:NAD-dependent epimerase/dehydratase family protein n=1 Tax=Croceibacterium xixiisoli TaxID=1476466 RepID=A0A6I4TR41_9SPHN|nr:NAD(P)-dependent oxidoreductase [Croceibacterium xixiisoli]MXO97590.1 NAD-dependent epimerase/dehydratase family protein [Croceibacterium xixiisoli]